MLQDAELAVQLAPALAPDAALADDQVDDRVVKPGATEAATAPLRLQLHEESPRRRVFRPEEQLERLGFNWRVRHQTPMRELLVERSVGLGMFFVAYKVAARPMARDLL
jgi:hypothetical protein